MTDLAEAQVAGPCSGRAMARAMLDAALSGVELTELDRRFLCRLSQWDKRNAATVASLLARARQRGRMDALADIEQPDLARRAEVIAEPVAGQPGDGTERARLGEQVRRAGHDHQLSCAAHLR